MKSKLLSSEEALELLAEKNPKWYRERSRNLLLGTLFLALLLLYFVLLHAQKEFSFSYPLLFRSEVYAVITPLLLIAVLTIFLISVVEYVESLECRRKGFIRRKAVYHSKQGYRPFAGTKSSDEAKPLEGLQHLPHLVPERTLYFCNEARIMTARLWGRHLRLEAEGLQEGLWYELPKSLVGNGALHAAKWLTNGLPKRLLIGQRLSLQGRYYYVREASDPVTEATMLT